MRRRNAQLLSAQALNNLFHLFIVHILPFIFCKDLFAGGLRGVLIAYGAVAVRTGRVTACLTALFTLFPATSAVPASEQDIFKGTQDRESH